MENGKQHQTEENEQEGSADKYQQRENDGEHDNQYSDDQGEDENGEKPSADDQE